MQLAMGYTHRQCITPFQGWFIASISASPTRLTYLMLNEILAIMLRKRIPEGGNINNPGCNPEEIMLSKRNPERVEYCTMIVQ